MVLVATVVIVTVVAATVVRMLVLELASDMSSTGVCTLVTGAPSSPVPSEEHVQLRISDCRSCDPVCGFVCVYVGCAGGCEALCGFDYFDLL